MLGAALLVAATLSSEPQTAVVISKTTTVAAAEVGRVADEVGGALEAAGVPVLPRAQADAKLADAGIAPTADCAGKPACLGVAASSLNVPGVVGVFVTEVVGEKTAFVSLVKRGEDKPTLKRDFLVVPGEKIGRAELGDFVEASKAVLAPPIVVLTEAPPKDHTSGIVVAGFSGASLLSGIVIGIVGVNAKAKFDTELNHADQYTLAHLQATAAPANTLPPIAIGLAVGAAALGGLAAWLW